MDPTLASPSFATTSRPSADSTPQARPWHARVRRLLAIRFDELDTLDLDLGTPKELDAYICDLFERHPGVGS